MKNEYYIVTNTSTSTPSYPIAYVKDLTLGYQETIYFSEVYSEGWNFQNGVYDYSASTVGITPILEDFFTLSSLTPNAFQASLGSTNGGDTARFTSPEGNWYDNYSAIWKDFSGGTLGTQTKAAAFPDNYMVDHYTGYGHYMTSGGLISYDNYIGLSGYIETQNTALLLGYSDWRGYTTREFMTLARYSKDDATATNMILDWTPFNNTSNWNSITTNVTNSVLLLRLSRNTGVDTTSVNKTTATNQTYLIRDHF